jgi:hypothetical protein
MKHDHCPDCGVGLGRKHKDGCDVERCPHCGGQALGCTGFDPNDPRREPWTGKWPGESDCERLGFFVGATARCRISIVCLPSVSGIRKGNGGSTRTHRDQSTEATKKGPGLVVTGQSPDRTERWRTALSGATRLGTIGRASFEGCAGGRGNEACPTRLRLRPQKIASQSEKRSYPQASWGNFM